MCTRFAHAEAHADAMSTAKVMIVKVRKGVLMNKCAKLF